MTFIIFHYIPLYICDPFDLYFCKIVLFCLKWKVYLCLWLNVDDMVLILSKCSKLGVIVTGSPRNIHGTLIKLIHPSWSLDNFLKMSRLRSKCHNSIFFSIKLNFQNRFKLDQGSKAPSAKTWICSLTHKGLYCHMSDNI